MKILGFNYSISKNKDSDNLGAYGKVLYKSQKIEVANDLCKEQEITTILHEIIEALDYHLQLNLEHPTIMSLEASIYQVMIDNGIDLTPLLDHIEKDK